MNLLKNKELIFDSIDLVNKCINSNKNDSGETSMQAMQAINLLGKVIKVSNEQTNKTMFYDDNNFFEKMKNSKYKKFIDKIKTLNISNDEYKLPIIVNIGNESSGKSSLIRNMLKCDIFPINKDICTKCPIKVELLNSDIEEYTIIYKDKIINLSDKEKLAFHTSVIMNSIDNIVDDELHIKISNKYVINSTFYDLPGIREYPADLREKSKNIINKYINQPNTLIICVIPANTARLTSNQSLGMIIDAKKTNDTIIALTKVDLLHNDDIELFVDRILMKSNEVKNLNVKKIIGVISHKNKDIKENVWFNNNLLNLYNDNTIKKTIEKSITVENLLISVDEMFNNFISTNWKINTIAKTNQKILELENEIKKLGKDIDLIQLFDFIYNEINFNYLLLADNSNGGGIKFNIDLRFSDNRTINDDIKKIRSIYVDYTKMYINSIIDKIELIFNTDNDYKLRRFTVLKEHLKYEYKEIMRNNMLHISIWFNNYMNKFKYELLQEDLKKLEKYINNNYNRYILLDLKNYKIDFNNKKLLEEDNEWIEKRTELNNSISTYKTHKSFFENL